MRDIEPGPGVAEAAELDQAVLAAQSDRFMRQMMEQRKEALAAAEDYLSRYPRLQEKSAEERLPLVLDVASYLLGERPARLAEPPDATEPG